MTGLRQATAVRIRALMIALAAAAASWLAAGGAAAAPAPLKLDVYTAPDRGYGVTSTLIYGPHEALLVDAQFTHEDAEAVADRVQALGRRLIAIVITHPDADHFLGLTVLRRRFPDVPVYISAAGLELYAARLPQLRADLARSKRPEQAPPDRPLAGPLARRVLVVDGRRVEVLVDMAGDVHEAPTNSAVWIPSSRALIAGDLAFDRVHPWLDQSTPAGRAAWMTALDRLVRLRPAVVVAGHKSDPARANRVATLNETRAYIAAFDAAACQAADPKALADQVKAAFPNWRHPLFLDIAAKSVFPRQGCGRETAA